MMEKMRQMLTLLTNLYCWKVYHRPDHSICIGEHQGEEVHLYRNYDLEEITFVVAASVLLMSSPKQTTAVLMPFFCHAKYLSYTNDFQWEK
jgi:hypothetical protein